MSEQYLVLTAVGTDRPGIVAELTAALAERGASVADSRMAILGGEFALMMLVSGAPPVLDAARSDVQSVGERLGAGSHHQGHAQSGGAPCREGPLL